MNGYCLKCRERKELANPQAVTFRGGTKGLQGVCAGCGTGMAIMSGARPGRAPTNAKAKKRATRASA